MSNQVMKQHKGFLEVNMTIQEVVSDKGLFVPVVV